MAETDPRTRQNMLDTEKNGEEKKKNDVRPTDGAYAGGNSDEICAPA